LNSYNVDVAIKQAVFLLVVSPSHLCSQPKHPRSILQLFTSLRREELAALSAMSDSKLRSYINDSKLIDPKKNEGMRALMTIKGNLAEPKNPHGTRFAAAELAIDKVGRKSLCLLFISSFCKRPIVSLEQLSAQQFSAILSLGDHVTPSISVRIALPAL
jgi:hypothetical protein